MSFRKPCHMPFRNTLSFFYPHHCKFSLQTFWDCCKVPIKNFVVRTLKTRQVGNICSPRGCQENLTLVKCSNGDKMPTKALYLNTGDKTKSKYSPQKILSSIKREWVNWIGIKTVQVTFHVAWSGLIDSASVKPFVIGENPQEENCSCKFGALQLSLQGINVLRAGAYQNRKWELKDFEKVYKLECRENRTCSYTMTIFDYNYQNSFRFCFVI